MRENKLLKKSLIYVLSALILTTQIFAGSAVTARADEAFATNSKPDLRMERGYMAPVKANEKFVIPLRIDNKSMAYGIAKGKITVTMPDSLMLQTDTNIFYLADTGIPVNGYAEFEIPVKATDKITSENLSVSINFEYQYWGSDGLTSGSDSYTVLVPATVTTASESQPMLQIVRGKVDKVKAKENFDLDLKVKNLNKEVAAENVKVTIKPGAGLTLNSKVSSKYVDKITKDEPYELKAKLKADKTIDKESLDVTLDISYSYKQNGTVTQGTASETVSIPSVPNNDTANPQDGDGILTPNIIVSSYDYGKKIEAGQEFTLDLKFKNTSKDTAVQNIVMSLNTGDGISVASSSNSFYFDKLGAGGELAAKTQLRAWEDAKSAAAIVTVSFNYEYLNKKSVVKGQTSETIAIPVVQPDRFEISQPTGPDMPMEGKETVISVPYVNKGKATVANISGTIKGEGFEPLSKDVWIGNCSSGSNGSIDFILTPNQPGDMTAKLVIKYENANAEQKTKKIEVPFTVEAMQEELPPDMPDESEMPVEKKTIPSWIIALIVTAGVIVVLVIVIKKLKKRADQKRNERLKHMYDWAVGGDENNSEDSEDNKKDDKKE